VGLEVHRCLCIIDAGVWLQSRSLPARGRVGLEGHRCLCIIDAGNVFISTAMGPDIHRRNKDVSRINYT